MTNAFIKLFFSLPFLQAILLSRLVLLSSASSIVASFVFGDSLVDSGNNNYIATLSRADFPPYGIDLLPDRRPTGRYTNGRTIPDIIGQELGLNTLTPPYLSPTTTGGAILHGVNYASGAGGILNETGRLFGARINLDAQIDNFANTRQDLISTLGEGAAQDMLRNSLFSVTIGSNDFINNYLLPLGSSPKKVLASPRTFVEGLISKYRVQLMRLYILDARRIVISNIGPIGCMPLQRDTSPSIAGGCAEFPNKLASLFNERLKTLITELNSNLEEANFVHADVFSIVLDIIQNYSSYGFEVADSACCRTAGRHGGLLPCGMYSQVCLDRSKYVFWDAYHPTEAMNMIVAKRLIQGDSSDVSPMSIRQLMVN